MRNGILLVAACATAFFMLSTAHVNALPPDSEFEVVMVAISANTWASIKYNTETGEAWHARDGKWVRVEDEPGIPKGRYVIRMTGLANDWSAIRLEVKTGKSWQCRESKWVEIAHATQAPENDSVGPKPSKKGKE